MCKNLKPQKNSSNYFDSDYWDESLETIQNYYKKRLSKKKILKKEQENINNLFNELGKILLDMSNKIIKDKKLCSPGDLQDVVNECVCNCFHLLEKGKYKRKRGRSFSWLTSVIQHTAIWYHFKNNSDIPFAVFQEKSFIEEDEENLMLYLAEYYQTNCYRTSNEITKSQSKNITRKKELRLMPFYTMVDEDFEDNIFSKMDTILIRRLLSEIVTYFEQNQDKYDKYEVIIADSILKYIQYETKIDRITIRRFKKFVVDYFIKEVKKKRWKFKGKNIDEINRQTLIIFINKVFNKKIKPFFMKNSNISEMLNKD